MALSEKMKLITGAKYGSIRRVLRKERNRTKGYQFRYLEGIE